MLYLLFQIGNDRYALEARHAVEVVPFLELKRIPHAPRGVAGMFNFRGQPVPAVDLSELTFGHPAHELFSTRIIIVRVSSSDLPTPTSASGTTGTPNLNLEPRTSKLLGLIAEHATGMMRREARDFINPGAKVANTPYLGPVVMDDQGVIQLLRAEHLLTQTLCDLVSGADSEESEPDPRHLPPGTSDP